MLGRHILRDPYREALPPGLPRPLFYQFLHFSPVTTKRSFLRFLPEFPRILVGLSQQEVLKPLGRIPGRQPSDTQCFGMNGKGLVPLPVVSTPAGW